MRSGDFGVVYRAYQTTVGREVAIKIILPHFANHPDFIRRFETEAQLIARLEHLHIVPLYDFWRDPDGAYLVMRWLLTHRYVRELSCDERALYQLTPGCDAAGGFATRTPYPTGLPTGASAQPLPSRAAAGASPTTTPTVTPRPTQMAQVGENQGVVSAGDSQVWQYAGRAGETLTIRVRADESGSESGVLDTRVIVTAPDGRDLNVYDSGGGMVFAPPQSDDIEAGVNTDLLVEGLVLPVDGTYQIIVSGSGYRTGGAYTMVMESGSGESVTPTPGVTPLSP